MTSARPSRTGTSSTKAPAAPTQLQVEKMQPEVAAALFTTLLVCRSCKARSDHETWLLQARRNRTLAFLLQCTLKHHQKPALRSTTIASPALHDNRKFLCARWSMRQAPNSTHTSAVVRILQLEVPAAIHQHCWFANAAAPGQVATPIVGEMRASQVCHS